MSSATFLSTIVSDLSDTVRHTVYHIETDACFQQLTSIEPERRTA